MGVIPGNWENYKSQGYLAHGTGPQIIFVDFNVVRTTGKPSIRIERHTAADINTARECNGIWYSVKPGDHIVAKSWMKVQTGPSTHGYPQCGARIGIDFYGATGILPADAFWTAYFGGDFSKGYVQDSNGGAWQQRTLDFTVPATATDVRGNPQVPTSLVLWVQGAPWTADATASTVWFTDAELYINPAATPPVTRTLTVLAPASGQGSINPTVGKRAYNDKQIAPVYGTANAGYELADWLINGQSQLPWWPKGSNNPIYVTMDADYTIQAVFTALPRPLSNVQIAVSSVTASSNDGYYVPNMAIDGIENPSNYWGTDAKVPQGRVPQWLKLDLGSVHRINTVTTHFYDGSVRTYTYYLEVSNDSSSWTTIVSTKTGSGSVTDMFSQVGARFVRIIVTANTANPAAHIEEIKVHGFS